MGTNAPTTTGGAGSRLLSLFWRSPADTLAERTRRKISLHLIPFLFFLYILAYLDRVNVSVAGLAMHDPSDQGGLGFSQDVIGFGAGIFFWGYWILEIPSSVSVVRWGARWVFARILVLWGVCAALVGVIGSPAASSLFAWLPHVSTTWAPLAGTAHFINGLHDSPAYQFYFLRFMLGFFEGGFFPSVIVYLSHWFRARDRAKAIAGFMSAIPIASMTGMPVSGLLLKAHWFGLPGWRWIFILEGVAPVLAGVATLFLLPDRPSEVKWLSAEERDWLLGELDREHQAKKGQGHGAWAAHLGTVLLLTAVYFCLNVSSYGLSMFMPAIIKSQTGASSTVASCLAALPFVMALIAMLVNGWHSDRTGERPWHVAAPLALWTVGILLAVALDAIPVWPAVVMILFVGTFMYAHLPAFWPIPTMFLGATAAASAIGFINMIGNLGGSVGPMVVGSSATDQLVPPSAAASAVGLMAAPPGPGLLAAAGRLAPEVQTRFAGALVRIAPWPLAAAVLILVMAYTRRKTLAKPPPDSA